MTLTELFKELDPLDKQGKGEEVYGKLRLFIKEKIDENHVNDNTNSLKFILVRILAYRSLNDEHKKSLLDLLCESGYLIQMMDGLRIALMLDKYPYYFDYCINKLGDHKQKIIDTLNGDDFNKALLSFSTPHSDIFRRLVIFDLFSEKVIAFIKESEPKSEDATENRDFYNSYFVQIKLPERKKLRELLEAISILDRNRKGAEIFETFKDFVEKLNLSHFTDKDLLILLMKIMSADSLSLENRKTLLNLLCKKATLIRFPDAEEIVAMIQIRADDFCYFFRQSSSEQKTEIATALNSDSFNKALSSFSGLTTEVFRGLMNCGLEAKKVISFFQDVKLQLSKTKFGNFIFSSLFPEPNDEDAPAYRDFYESDFVKIILPEFRRKIRLSLLFPTGERRAALEGIAFDRDGGSFVDSFYSVKDNYLGLIQQKELKDFVGDTFKSFFSKKEKFDILQIVSGLMTSSPKENNRIVLLGTDRGGLHAEGLLLFDDLFLRVNRGARSSSQESGITIFMDVSRKKEDRDYLSHVESRSKDHHYILGGDLDRKIDGMGLKFVGVVEMKSQSMGNCSLATSKSFVLAAYYVAIRKILSERNPPLTDKALHDQAAFLAKKIYKEFTRLYRLEEAKSYLVWSAEHQFKYVDEKILAKIIGYFETDPSINRIIEKNNLFDRLSKEALLLALKTALSKENVTLIQYIMSNVQAPNAASIGLLPQAMDVLKDIREKFELFKVSRDPGKNIIDFRGDHLPRLNAFIRLLDPSLQVIMKEKRDEIFSKSKPKVHPITIHPQFDMLHQYGHPKPPEPDAESPAQPSPENPRW